MNFNAQCRINTQSHKKQTSDSCSGNEYEKCNLQSPSKDFSVQSNQNLPSNQTFCPKTITLSPKSLGQTSYGQCKMTNNKESQLRFEGKKTFAKEQTLFNRADDHIKQLSEHPLKQPDQPKSSFYPQGTILPKIIDHNDTFKRSNNQVVQPIAQQALFHFHDKQERIKPMTSQEKMLTDYTSNIFHREDVPVIYKGQKETQKLMPSKVTWNENHLSPSSCQVNENAQFSIDYSRNRKQLDAQSNMFSDNPQLTPKRQIPNKSPTELEPNKGVKRRNQNFSDIFDLEYGFKHERQKQRSLSPNIKWDQHDSIRNRGDFQKNLQPKQKDEKELTRFGSSRLSENFIKCGSTYKSIKGELKSFEDMAVTCIEKKAPPINEGNMYRSAQKVVYSGMYTWKNNYKKRT